MTSCNQREYALNNLPDIAEYKDSLSQYEMERYDIETIEDVVVDDAGLFEDYSEDYYEDQKRGDDIDLFDALSDCAEEVYDEYNFDDIGHDINDAKIKDISFSCIPEERVMENICAVDDNTTDIDIEWIYCGPPDMGEIISKAVYNGDIYVIYRDPYSLEHYVYYYIVINRYGKIKEMPRPVYYYTSLVIDENYVYTIYIYNKTIKMSIFKREMQSNVEPSRTYDICNIVEDNCSVSDIVLDEGKVYFARNFYKDGGPMYEYFEILEVSVDEMKVISEKYPDQIRNYAEIMRGSVIINEKDNLILSSESRIYIFNKNGKLERMLDMEEIVNSPVVGSVIPILGGIATFVYEKYGDKHIYRGLLGISNEGEYLFLKSYDIPGVNKIVDEKGRVLFIDSSDKPLETNFYLMNNCGEIVLNKKYKNKQVNYFDVVALTNNSFLINSWGEDGKNSIEILNENLESVLVKSFDNFARISGFYFGDCGELYFDVYKKYPNEYCIVKSRISGYGLGRSIWPMNRGDPRNTDRVQKW